MSAQRQQASTKGLLELENLLRQSTIPVVEVKGQGLLRSLTLALNGNAKYIGIVPPSTDPVYTAISDTTTILGRLTGPGILTVTIDRMDMDAYFKQGQWGIWNVWKTLNVRTNLRGDYSIGQSFPTFYATGPWLWGLYRIHVSTYPLGRVTAGPILLMVRPITQS